MCRLLKDQFILDGGRIFILRVFLNFFYSFLFQCWSAASLLKQKIDRKQSLSLAKHHLKFCCNEEEASYVYSVLKKLQKTFKENMFESDFSKDSVSGAEDVTKGPVGDRVSKSMSSRQAQHDVSVPKNLQNDNTDVELTNFRQIQRKCKKRIAKLRQKQEKEIKEFHEDWEKRRKALEDRYTVESAVICEMYSHSPLRTDRLKFLNSEHSKKMEEFEHLKEEDLKELKEKQLLALNDERNKGDRWLKSAASSATEGRDHYDQTLGGSDFESQLGHSQSQASEFRSHSFSENDATISSHLIEEQSPSGIADNRLISGVTPADTCMIAPNRVVGCNSENGNGGAEVNPHFKNDLVEKMLPVAKSPRRNENPLAETLTSVNVSENNGLTSRSQSAKQIDDELQLSKQGETAPPKQPERSPEDVMGTVDTTDIETPAVEPNEMNNRDACPDIPISVENHCLNGDADKSSSGDPTSLPFHQPTPSPACDNSLSSNLVFFF